MSQCLLCRLLRQIQDRRVYVDNDDFVVFEHLNTMSPILVAKEHGDRTIPLEAFDSIKAIAIKLYGEAFCLAPTSVGADHFSIKVIRLLS